MSEDIREEPEKAPVFVTVCVWLILIFLGASLLVGLGYSLSWVVQ